MTKSMNRNFLVHGKNYRVIANQTEYNCAGSSPAPAIINKFGGFMSKLELYSLFYLAFVIIGSVLIFVFYDWKLFLIFFLIGMSNNICVFFNIEKHKEDDH